MSRKGQFIIRPPYAMIGETGLRAFELPHTVKEGALFHEHYAFLDYFCGPAHEIHAQAYRLHELEAYDVNRSSLSHSERKSWNRKHDWMPWLRSLGKSNFLTVFEPEIVPKVSAIKFNVFEVYFRKGLLEGSALDVPKVFRNAASIDFRLLRYPE